MIVEKKISMSEWDVNNPSSIKAWEDVSAEYAKQVVQMILILMD
jgi:hypothetical protein